MIYRLSMKRNIVISILCLFCLVPASIIGFINRPKNLPHWAETKQAVPAAQAAIQPTIVLDPIMIKGVAAKKKTQKPIVSEKVWVCRDIPMLNGGTVEYCDYL